MATANPFDLLGDDDNDDPSQLIATVLAKPIAPAPFKKAAAEPAKLPSKPIPPTQAVRESRSESGRGRGRGFGRGRDGGGYNQEPRNNDNTYSNDNGFSAGYRPSEDRDAAKSTEKRGFGGPRPPFRGGDRGGGSSNGEAVEGEYRPRREFERHSGTGRGNTVKREGSGRGNWGIPTDVILPENEEPVIEVEKNTIIEKQVEEETVDESKEKDPVTETDEKGENKEPEAKEMTLEEYEKVLEEKRKALLSQKSEERKVVLDKDLKTMQQLSNKKTNQDVFIKLGSEKSKGKEAAEKEEKAKKSLSINEFLKPADGERNYSPGSRGGRGGRGGRGVARGGNSGSYRNNVEAPPINNADNFPSLGAK